MCNSLIRRVMLPRVFIGSSKESLAIARAIQEELEYDAEVTVWSQGIFAPSRTALDDLIGALDRFDFGVFVFAPDDLVRIGSRQHTAARDNVVFEMGLFVGARGRERSFFVMPRRRPDFRLPSDLAGLTPVTYDARRTDGNLQAALGTACNKIRKAIRQAGPRAGGNGAAHDKDLPAIPLPRVRRAFTDVAKKQYLKGAFDRIRAYFERAAHLVVREYPIVQADVEALSGRQFLCELFVDGYSRNKCSVWISDSRFGVQGLAYAEGDISIGLSARVTALLPLIAEDEALFLQIAPLDAPSQPTLRATPDEAAEHLWTRFAAALQR